jgi:branched-chain amino acid transport system permease protein
MVTSPDILLQTLLNGFLMGAVYGVAAIGLSLVWGVLGLVNLSHGALLIAAAYITFLLYAGLGAPPLVSAPLAFLIGAAAGLLFYRGFGKRLTSTDPSYSLLFFFGLALFLTNTILNLLGPDVRGIPWLIESATLGPVSVSVARLISFGLVGISFITLYLFINKTFYGKAIRAVVANRLGAVTAGIDVQWVFAVSTSIGFGITFFSGSLVALVNPFTPSSGDGYLMYAFATVVLGGVGSTVGAFLAGILLGIVESFVGVLFTQGVSPAVAFITLVLVILFRYGRR